MMPRCRLLLDKACYHLIARGNQKRNTFVSDCDYKSYIDRLRYYKRKFDFRLYGYCLMPNHVHLLGEIADKTDLSKFMQCLNRSYAAYFNETYDKAGHLWQGRFKSKVIVKDEYLVNAICYIEENPIRTGIVQAPHDYKWSSYLERNLGVSDKKSILDKMTIF